MQLRNKIILIFTFLVVLKAFGQNQKKLAIVFNQSSSGTESSNPDFEQTKSTIDWAVSTIINKKEVQVKFFDSKNSAIGTYESIKEINAYNPDIVVGFGHSYQAILAKKELNTNIKLISPVATSDDIIKDSNNTYLLSNTNSAQSKKVISELKRENLKSNLILIKIVDSLYSTNFIENLITELKKSNQKYILIPLFQNDFLKTENLSDKISAIKEEDTIVLPCIEYDSGIFLKVLSKKYKSFKLIGTDGWGTSGIYVKDIFLTKAQEVVWFTNYHPKNLSRGNKKFLNQFNSVFTKEPIDTNAFWYESIKIANLMITTKNTWLNSLHKIDSVTELVAVKPQTVDRKMSKLTLKNKLVEYVGDY